MGYVNNLMKAIERRLKAFSQLQQASKVRSVLGKTIRVQLPNNASFEGRSGELTPLDIIKALKHKEPYVFANVRCTAEG